MYRDVRITWSLLLIIYSGDETKNEVGEACGTYGEEEWWLHGFSVEIWEHSEDLGVDGRIILKWMFKAQDGGVDWIDLGRETDKRLSFLTRLVS
jgi:hypothetical protein